MFCLLPLGMEGGCPELSRCQAQTSPEKERRKKAFAHSSSSSSSIRYSSLSRIAPGKLGQLRFQFWISYRKVEIHLLNILG